MRTEIANTDTRIADLRVEVLKEIGGVKTEIGGVKTEMADVKTLIADREASMQRWLLGITSTMVVAVTAVLIRSLA